MRKTICLMTNWYPTAENPYRGSFFQEQAFAVEDRFDFLVVHYTEKTGLIPKKDVVRETRRERNTVEYEVSVTVPMLPALYDELYSLFMRLRGIDWDVRKTSPWRKRFTRKTLEKVFRERLQQEIDAFYCVDAQTEAYQARCAAEARGKPLVIGEHAPFPWPGSVISDVNREAMENADLFLAISRDKIRQIMMQNIRLPETVYIGNLVDETRLTVAKKPQSHTPVLLIVAARSFYKNYDLFVRVMDRLTEITEVPFKALIVGYASNKNYSAGAEDFEAQVRGSAFADKAELIREVAHEQIAEVYQRADVFVMTSIQEGQPVSAMEAACCGLPVYATRCGGVEDYIDPQMGRIYAIDDCEGMAQGLKEYLEGGVQYDPAYIREQVIRRFGRKAFADTFTGAFAGVIKNA